MNKKLHLLMAVLLGIGVTEALAQRASEKAHVDELKQLLPTLKWESIDFGALPALDRCRALTILDHVLTEIGAVATAEADLMSQYLDQQDLGAQFASSPLAETAPKRTYEDGQKIAAALLQGPLAESRYATMYQGTDDAGLRADLNLHASNCKRKWSKFSWPVQHVRGMTAFIKSQDKYGGYLIWSNTESGRRQVAHDQIMADNRATVKAKSDKAKADAAAGWKAQEQQRKEEDQLEVENSLAQQAIWAEAVGNVAENRYDDDYLYPNRYHRSSGSGQNWHKNGENQERGRENTNRRVTSWQGSGGTSKKGSGRR